MTNRSFKMHDEVVCVKVDTFTQAYHFMLNQTYTVTKVGTWPDGEKFVEIYGDRIPYQSQWSAVSFKLYEEQSVEVKTERNLFEELFG